MMSRDAGLSNDCTLDRLTSTLGWWTGLEKSKYFVVQIFPGGVPSQFNLHENRVVNIRGFEIEVKEK